MDKLQPIPRIIGYYKGKPIIVDFATRKTVLDKVQSEVKNGQ